jgi:TonB-linked SusC/RagA family outer membrane protein
MKFKFALLCVAIILAGFVQQIMAQTLSVTGKVLNKSTGESLVGATVNVQGTTKSVLTDGNGIFKITVNKGATLVVSYVGLTTTKQIVTNAGPLNFSLTENAANNLNDVVVVGYGTQKITNVSGSIATIKASDIQKINAVRVEDAIQGRASGVTVVQSGSPGSTPTVFIRGIPSYAGSDPLVVIDGVQQSLVDFNSLSPSDIESINILKDAATTSIYGVKGGNGVIVITTKSGKRNQKTQLSINSSYGYQEVARTIGVLNATEYGAIVNEGSTLSGGGVIFPNLAALGVGTNWQDQIFKQAPFQNHSITATGGSEKTTFFLSASYADQSGIVGGQSKSDYSRGNFTANLNFQLTPKLKFILNTTAVLLNSKGVAENSFNSVIGSALNFDPTVPVYNNVPNTVGTYGFSNLILAEVHNPLTTLDNTYNQNTGQKLYGKFEFQYDIIKNLKLTTRFGYTDYNDNGKSFTPLVFYGINNVDNTMNADGSTVLGKHNSVSSTRNSNFNYRVESFANYAFDVKQKHHFEVVAGINFLRNHGNQIGASKQDVPFNSWAFADLTAATGTNTATNPSANSGYYYEYKSKNVSTFARINYDFEGRYLASFSARRDGSYSFGLDKQFGNFFSGSAGWVLSKEKFFQSKLINFLKLRGSYGTVGSDANTNPQSTNVVTGGPYSTIGNSNGYNFGNLFYPGTSISSQSNPLLGWENQKQGNIGFDVTLLNNKISITADYFQKNVDGLLFTPTQSLYLGTVPAPTANIGSTSTKGFDATVTYNTMIAKSVKLNTSVTFTTFNSLVTATNTDNSAQIPGGYYFNGQSQSATLFAQGYSPGIFWGYKTDGLFQTQSDIAKAAKQSGAQPGDIKYVDVNNDGVIDSKDLTQIGNPFPKFTLGWNINLEYKNFDVSAFIYASVGNDIFRAYERNANYTNKFRSVLGRWTGPGTTNNAATPRYVFTDANNNARVSDRYVEDGSFVKIKNLQLGYTMPNRLFKNSSTRIRIYAQAKNLYTFTKYSGYDPEISGGILSTGVDYGAYPQARSFLFGVDVKF